MVSSHPFFYPKTFPNHSQDFPKSFPVQIVDNLPYGFIRVALHDAHIVEDWAVTFHGLTDAILQRFKGNADVEAMLHEGLTGSVWADAAFYPDVRGGFLY